MQETNLRSEKTCCGNPQPPDLNGGEIRRQPTGDYSTETGAEGAVGMWVIFTKFGMSGPSCIWMGIVNRRRLGAD